METTITDIYHSPIGLLKIKVVDDAITNISFLDELPAIEQEVKHLNVPAIINECKNQLDEYFAGKRKSFNLPVKTTGTDFQQKVWGLLCSIPYGKTISYLELSKLFGNTKAIRAVAAANGKNPVALIIPCHRVIGNDGKLVGYAGKLWRKQWLLELERAIVNNQQSLFQMQQF